ncbi:PP2C family protein-serine/threonine phosphatase [Kineococcus sp. SYSU DK018]|uniref:PP2C family protein-serine/threonine phosphatase n=1 Tax=Kineococcus sp. SYSU DK018 TaxID=3383139 RepID=UPI003D7E7753
MTAEPMMGERARRRWLPHGTPLPDDVWRSRHRTFLTAAWVICVLTLVWAGTVRGVVHAVLDCLPIAVAASAGTLASLRIGTWRWGREAASCAVMLALMIASAVAVHLAGGLIEAHFLFFIAVGAAAAYQTWAPFLVAIGFVLVHHGLLASVSGHAIFNHPAAQQRPWLWALIHGALLAAAAAVGVASWRADELVRARLDRLGARSRLILGTVTDGIVALDAEGRVLEANPAALRLLTTGPLGLASIKGRELSELVHGYDHGRSTAAGRVTSAHRASTCRAGTRTPVEITVALVHDDERVRAVVTLRDLSSAARAEDAERALLEVAEREQAQREDVAALMTAVRPPTLCVPGLQLAVAYEPAASAPAGGDLYDWLLLPSGEVLIVVVDAMGRGTGATREALAVTSTVRTLAVAGVELGDLVDRAGSVVEVTHPELMATVLIAVLDPGTGRLRLAGGGHPPAILVGTGGAREVAAHGRGVGYPEPGSVAITEVVLAPGESLVLYTDGLLEGTRDIDAGLRELAGTAAGMARAPVQEFAQRLLTEVSTCAREDDDCLALVIRRSPVARDSDPPHSLAGAAAP